MDSEGKTRRRFIRFLWLKSSLLNTTANVHLHPLYSEEAGNESRPSPEAAQRFPAAVLSHGELMGPIKAAAVMKLRAAGCWCVGSAGRGL